MNEKIICPDCKSYEKCTQFGWADAEKCVNFEHRDYEQILVNGFEENLFIHSDSAWAVGTLNTEDLMSNTIEITGCERIIFRDKTLNFQFEIGHDQYKDIDTIIVNGIKFKKEC